MVARKKYTITKKHSTKPNPNVSINTHKYTKYYPSILDPNFSHKIASHNIFKKYKLTVNQKRLNDLYNAYETNIPMPVDSKKHESNIYILKNILHDKYNG